MHDHAHRFVLTFTTNTPNQISKEETTIQAEGKATEIRKATIKDIPELAETLAQAFDKDPVMQWIIRQDKHRTEALRDAFEYYLSDSIPYGEVTITDDLKACAMWLPPGVWSEKPPLLEYLGMLVQIVKWSGLGRIRRFIEDDNLEYARKPAEPHYYLAILGVRPGFQGKRYGSRLIEYTLARVDELEMPAYLENSNIANQSLYESHGFKVIDSFTLSKGGPTEWCMWREPVTRQQQKA